MSRALHRPLRFLVLDAYARAGREALAGAGGTPAGTLYERMLRRFAPGAKIDVGHPADSAEVLPRGVGLADYDGVAWTGSSLTIYDAGDARVRRQLELARAVARAGVPSFGSCWAAQLAVAAAGGRCAASEKGREFGIARKITIGPEGRTHPLFRGKPEVFDAYTSHEDEAVSLPDGATLLASNDWSRVQAVCVLHGRASFWALQYHPEYDLGEVAALCRLRADELIAQGRFLDRRAAAAYVADLEGLHADPGRSDLATRLDVASDLLDPEQRTLEVGNWIEYAVKPSVRG